MPPKRDPRDFKPREERCRTVLPARLRHGGGWSDACILNVSSRGLMIYANCTPQPGSQVELRRGNELVIARVVWRQNSRIGLCSTDTISVQEIVSGEGAAAAAAATAGAALDRRQRARNPDRSRASGQAFEFFSVILIGIGLAAALMAYAHQTLAKPLAAVERALAAR